MAIYKVCPKCGAHLDLGEQCSCECMEEKLLDQLTVEMKRTDEFYQAARELGDYIRPLPLSQPQNDYLIKLIIDQVNTAERGAFLQGFKTGMDIAKATRDKGVIQ